MATVLTMSIWSGRRIAKRGRYRVYPIVGTTILTVGLLLLAVVGLGIHTSYWNTAIWMALIGAGMGLTMQVMILATQNSVDYSALGVATSAVTFFRSIGGSLGVAVFGTIFSNRLASELAKGGGPLGKLGGAAAHLTPAQLKAMKAAQPALFDHLLHGFSNALHTVFYAGVPFAALGIVCALLLRDVPLRQTNARGAGLDAAEGQAMPTTAETAMTRGTPAATR
jgi:hypothetical protein